ncbi:hypothetical protein [Acidimangrovimonas pyrenivorans]|uniref:Uncharacterized protein n=1 Tax=Acidimangrovimonas pyrenivorans TaxID=2030798 RepID=A0ABV7AC48_9RHOB
MNAKSPDPKTRKARPEAGQESREDRLKAALKANLARRKAQARSRKAADEVTGGAAGDGETGEQ